MMDRQFGKKLKTSRTFSGPFPSPESPPKGWYSERVHQTGIRGVRGYDMSAALLPFSSGRALPSKWDEAERWITSPVSVGNGSNLGYNAQRRAKSKSGPLGPLGLGSYGNFSTFSPVLGVGDINGGKWRHSIAIESGTEARDLLEGLDTVGGGVGGSDGDDSRRRSCPGQGQEWLDLWNAPLSPSDKRDLKSANNGFETNNSNDDNNSNAYDEAGVERVISRRDMATQMYPESESSSFSANSPRPLLNNEYETKMSIQNPEFEVRDVQIDRQTSRATQRSYSKGNEPIENFSDCSSTIVVEDSKMIKLQREEARINAWENLQKAKAESAIQKLEMKLEKERASTMEKIIEKLRRAEIKAQKMRGSLGDGSDHVQSRVFSKNTSKIPSFFNKIRLSSSRSCLTCYPF